MNREKEIKYIDFIKIKIPDFDKLPKWEQQHIKKANKIDYNLYLITKNKIYLKH